MPNVAVDRQVSARARARRRLALGLFHVGEDSDGAIVEDLTFWSELQLAGGTVDEPRAESCLQPRDKFADAGRRQSKAPGGGGEAAALDDADEHFHLRGAVGVEARHDEFIS